MSPYSWMLCGAFSFSVMATLASSLGGTFPWQWIAVGRSTVPFLVFGATAWASGVKLPLWRPRTLWVRSVAGSLSLICTFFALTRLPSSDVLTLTNIFPVWVALLSWPLLGQRPTLGMGLCALVAVAGCALILQPHFAEGNLATFAALAASLTTSVAMLGLHRLHGFDTRVIVWHFSGVSLLFCFGALLAFDVAAQGKTEITPRSFLVLAGVGTAAMLGQYCLTKAFTIGVPSRVSVVGLTQVGFVVAFEVLCRGRTVGPSTLAGMLLVLAPTAWLLIQSGPTHVPPDAPENDDTNLASTFVSTEL